jgi:hypothetical protein
MRESDIQAQILNVLRRLSFVRVDRYQTGMLPNPEGQLVPFGSPGSADIQVCVGPLGRLLGLECKRPNKKLEAAQIVWAADVTAKGGFAYRVDALDDACRHVLYVYERNLVLLRAAGELDGDAVATLLAAARQEMADAKQRALETQDKKSKRKGHLPQRRKLPPGTNSAAGI